MKVTLMRVAGTCPECNLTGIAVFDVQIDFADFAFPIGGCAACLSALGASLQYQARIINKATA